MNKTSSLFNFLARKIGNEDMGTEADTITGAIAELGSTRTLYTWYAYADDANGTGISLDPTGKAYVGVAPNRTSETPYISDPTVYTWQKIVGDRGSLTLNVTTEPSVYSTTTEEFTPSYRILLSTVLSQSGAADVRVGDTIEKGYYHYPVGYVDGTYAYLGERSSIRGATGETGAAGEDATVLRIDSSRGVLFKTNYFSTTLTVTIQKGALTITTAAAMHAEYGAGAYLQWYWRKFDDEDWRIMLVTDSHISDNGFSLTITPDDVDEKIVFKCDLITD